MSSLVYSVGHGSRRLAELVGLLHDAGVETLVDVRARPSSRHNPQFNEDALRDGLRAARIRYAWAGRGLGGMRRARPGSPHRAFAGSGMQGYADHMDGEPFARHATWLVALAARSATAMMCAEREPLRCHRSLIADWLLVRGVAVVHLIGPGERVIHGLRPDARRDGERLVYDRNTQATLL